MKEKLNKYSSKLTESLDMSHAQSMLYDVGLSQEDMHKPQIGIASVWYDGNPCNMHLRSFGDLVKESVLKEEMIGMRFSTVGVSDVISMGNAGMRYSLQSRDLIADSIETMMGAHWYDGCIAIPGCDKNMPGCMIALARLNRPSFIIYGGTIRPGCVNKQEINIIDSFKSAIEYQSGKISKEDYDDIIRHACNGPGACGAMYTANTMASIIAAMGLSLPASASNPASSESKKQECMTAGQVMKTLLEKDIKPLDIMTREAFENAIVMAVILGGSTNAVLHLLAIARAANVRLSIDDFAHINNKTPLLGDMLPFGKYNMCDLHKVGGIPGVLKLLLEEKLIHGDCLTITGKSIAENLQVLDGLTEGQDVIRSIHNPISEKGHLCILKGNLAPEGAVSKITGKEGRCFTGPAKVFNTEESMCEAVNNKEISPGDVVVLRYQGPKGGPGMPEMLVPTSAIAYSDLNGKVALITDGRFSGASKGFIIGHITPEAQVEGPIALVENGDQIMIDVQNNSITLEISEVELENRKKQLKVPPLKAEKGALMRYIQTVKSASEGCVTDEV